MTHHKKHDHPEHDIFEDRNQFQVERVILFSDAVFAIAITLLVIEIKVPVFKAGETISYHEFINSLWEKFFEVLSYLLSFAVIGQFWTNHHRLFGYIKGYDGKLLWLNLHILFWIALMPFSTFLNMHYSYLPIVWFLYSLNMFFIALAVLFTWMYIGNKPHLCTMAHNKLFMRYARIRSISTTTLFMLGGLMAFIPGRFFMWSSHFFFILIFPALGIITRRYNKKAAVLHNRR
jgi:uncharacterized membrane protein